MPKTFGMAFQIGAQDNWRRWTAAELLWRSSRIAHMAARLVGFGELPRNINKGWFQFQFCFAILFVCIGWRNYIRQRPFLSVYWLMGLFVDIGCLFVLQLWTKASKKLSSLSPSHYIFSLLRCNNLVCFLFRISVGSLNLFLHHLQEAFNLFTQYLQLIKIKFPADQFFER